MILLKTSNKTALRSGMMVMFDDGMMSDGNGGVMFVCGGFFAVVWFVCWFVVEYCMAVGIVWQLVSVFCFSPFLVCKIEDRGQW